MTLSAAFVDEHITKWEAALTRPAYPFRSKWPSRLFHHAPLENAVRIIIDGNLRSRNDPANQRERDVAAAGVIDARQHAHDSVRLYFRPRNPTQWHIEGIRKSGECQYGEASHAPVLIMLVFEARRVLSLPDVKFCDRNMQLGAAEPHDTEEHFSAIPFDKVYHMGGTGGDASIVQHRCAEVLVPSPLLLDGSLQWIYCRTSAEKATLLHHLGVYGAQWAPRILVSDDLLVFERNYVFVEDVSLSRRGVSFRLNPRRDLQTVDVRISAIDKDGNQAIQFRNNSMSATPPRPSTGWIYESELADGQYLVDVFLEGHLAFRSFLSVGTGLF
ncbi:DUF4433 domain-containing protein [Mesorhizobium sp. CGMCC 1.15528]|uniref:DUF4433 domain-containing protein n=1 Tax=Mesorhizobium zhangyense TaxID=1776730 RepID=A0A7C9VA95_9HYPH|nr:DarT ssDNA thymidine ADP-ribosyltransferase family protein [Mesorhizobium zhangyense]NGN44865.1 DUF4433 domain-containing protein [Mesorhizobium zhangyense]